MLDRSAAHARQRQILLRPGSMSGSPTPNVPENENLPNGRYAVGRRSGVLPLARLQHIRLVLKGFAPRIHCPCHLNRNGWIRGHRDVRAGFATEDPETG